MQASTSFSGGFCMQMVMSLESFDYSRQLTHGSPFVVSMALWKSVSHPAMGSVVISADSMVPIVDDMSSIAVGQ